MSPIRSILNFAFLACFLAFQLSACASSVVVEKSGRENPPFSEKGAVFLFAGLVYKGETMQNSGMYTLTQDIRAAGVRADVYNPAYWKEAADDIIARPDAKEIPIAVGGYSMGGGAATRFAERLRAAGIPIQTLLVFEAYYPADVACNVREAIDMHGGVGSFNFAKRLRPSRTFRGHLTKVDWSKWQPEGGRTDHWGVSKQPEALRFVLDELIDGGKVRMRPESPGEAQCLAAKQ